MGTPQVVNRASSAGLRAGGRAQRAGALVITALACAVLGCGGSPGEGLAPGLNQPPGVAVCLAGPLSGQPCPTGNLNGQDCGVGELCVAAGTCIGGPNNGAPCPLGTECTDGVCPDVRLQADEVQAIMEAAARALDPSQYEVAVAVTDRRGVILGVGTNFPIDYELACADSPCPGNGFDPGSDPFTVDTAVQLARTAAFFSADQTPLTSRSIRFISGEHFPPGVGNTAAAALFGIENTNRGCSFDAVTQPLERSIPRAQNLCSLLLDGTGPLPRFRCESSSDPFDQCACTRGILTLPGAVPIYRIQGGLGRMAGGVGVFIRGVVPQPDPIAAYPPGSGILRYDDNQTAFAIAEFAARAYAGGPVGLPNVEGPPLKRICDNPYVTPPACCSQDPPCDFNVLTVRNPPFDPVIFIDGIEVPEVADNPPVGGGAGTFGRCSGSLEPCRADAPACPAGETCAAITHYIVPRTIWRSRCRRAGWSDRRARRPARRRSAPTTSSTSSTRGSARRAASAPASGCRTRRARR